MHHPHRPSPARGLLARIGMIATLALAGLSLSGCIFYVPSHYHHGGY